jgi:hypothetical protein
MILGVKSFLLLSSISHDWQQKTAIVERERNAQHNKRA